MNLDLNPKFSVEEMWTDLKTFSKDWDLVDNDPMIEKAFYFANNAHGDQKRMSGEPYLSHPVWVAKVVTQLGIGRKAIVASLLHDTVEDTDVTIDQIAQEFDDEVALLVEGLTEVRQKTKNIEVFDTNIDIFRQFLFSSVDDVRVLIIRIVDKLHNGLTIGPLSEVRQKRYAQGVLGIYSPVAEYVGLHYFKRLLDDIAFKILYPAEALRLENEIKKNKNYEIKALVLIKADIEESLKINHINNFEIEGRIKGIYSTYLKIKNKKYGSKRGFKDRVGVRILLDNVADCYTVLELIHSKYRYLEREFKDYISSPKANGYRSIQTTFNWKEDVSVEVQIRTKDMHEFNEFGPASHIAYKLSKGKNESIGYEWVKELINWQKGDKNTDNYRINVLDKFIYVFTPKGDTIQLKKGATGLDFAFRIHGDVGRHCAGVKINGKMGKIDDVLSTGDMVEVLTNKKVVRSKT